MDNITALINSALNEKDSKGYQAVLELEELMKTQDVLYSYRQALLLAIKDKSYSKRVRGFCLYSTLAKWDTEKFLDSSLEEALAILFDEKPTAVRMALQHLPNIIYYKPELKPFIKAKLLTIDTSRYKDTMAPLIKKDVDTLLESL